MMVVLLVSICIVESFLVAWLLHSQWLLPIEYIRGAVVGVNVTQLLYISIILNFFKANSNDEKDKDKVFNFHLHLHKKVNCKKF